MKHDNFGGFGFGEVFATSVAELMRGVATLFDHLVEDQQGASVIDHDTLVNFDTLNIGHGEA